jgi:hypothetical protein
MGKASSSKKVARAARAGGKTTKGPKRQIGYPIGIAVIVIVGVLAVLFARTDNKSAAAVSPTVGEHWHAAYGIYVCDAFLPPLTDVVSDTTGLHTHGDGIAHVHPFNSGAAGKNATLANWGKTTGISFTSTGFTANGTTYENGYDCNGQPATVSMYVWNADDLSAAPTVVSAADIGSFKFSRNKLALTIAVVPEGTVPPPPTTAGDIDKLDASTDQVVGGSSATSSTVAGATTGSTDSTASSTSTTAAGAP